MDGKIKTLRASGSQLQADVVVGSNQYGSDVAVQVKLDRKDPELVEAMEPLLALLSRRAHAFLEDAAVEQRVQERVRIDVATKLNGEKRRYERLAAHEVTSLVDQLQALVGPDERPLELWEVRRIQVKLRAARSATAEAAAS